MDIIQGYESSDSNEEENKSCNAKPKGLDHTTDKRSLEYVDFFSLSSTQFDSHSVLTNSSSSLHISQEYTDASPTTLESTKCLTPTMNVRSNEYSSSTSVPDMITRNYAYNNTAHECFVDYRRENVDLKHSRIRKHNQSWDRSNKKPYHQYNQYNQYTEKSSQVLNIDLQPYVPIKKKTFVSDEKCKKTIKKCMDSNMFTTPTLIAANIGKQNSQLPRSKYITFNDAHSAAVTHARWNIPRYSHLLLSASFDKSIKIWDCVDFNTCVSSIKSHTSGVMDAQWSKCGRQIISGGFDKSVKRHDVETGTCLESFPISSSITCLQFHPTEPNLFLAGTYGSAIYCFDTNSGKIVNEYKAKFGDVIDVAFFSNGLEFASASSIVGRDSANRTLMVWDFKTAAVVSNQLYHEKYTCPYLKVHPNENLLLAQSNANYIAIFSCRRPYKLNKFKRFEGHKVEGYSIGFDFSPDGSTIASGSSDGCVYFYNYKTSKLMKKLSCYGDNDACTDVGYHPVLAGVIATCSWKGELSVWQ